jgi:pimeloyl-ACP methyl ester carboxylesterase
MQLHHTQLGSGDPLLVLHGLLGSHHNLLPACRKFAEHFHVFAIDQRNHGHSPHHEEMHYDAMADDIARFMDRHNLAAAHVLGHSMGGKTAMQFALNHPARVRKLVVVDIAPRAYHPRHDTLIRALRELTPAELHSRHEADVALAHAVPEKSLRQFLLKNLMPDGHGGYRWRINLDSIAANYYGSLREAVRGSTPFPGETLFLLGGKSDYVGETDRAGIKKLFPRAEFETIAEASHWVHAEKPAEFADAVLRFLNRQL